MGEVFGFYNVLFLADVLRVLMYEFTYDQPTPLKSDVQRSLQERCREASTRGALRENKSENILKA